MPTTFVDLAITVVVLLVFTDFICGNHCPLAVGPEPSNTSSCTSLTGALAHGRIVETLSEWEALLYIAIVTFAAAIAIGIVNETITVIVDTIIAVSLGGAFWRRDAHRIAHESVATA